MAAILAHFSIFIVENEERIPRNRLMMRRAKAFDLPDEKFIENFRLSKRLTQNLIEELQNHLQPRTCRRNAFVTETKICNIFISSIYNV